MASDLPWLDDELQARRRDIAASRQRHPAGKALGDLRFISEWPPGNYSGDDGAIPMDNQRAVEELLARVTHAIPPFEEAAGEVYAELLDLLVTKQNDYGPDAINRAPGGALHGVMVRLHDKYERLRHLSQVGIAPAHESIRDTYLDLANYAVIALMVIDGTWPQ